MSFDIVIIPAGPIILAVLTTLAIVAAIATTIWETYNKPRKKRKLLEMRRRNWRDMQARAAAIPSKPTTASRPPTVGPTRASPTTQTYSTSRHSEVNRPKKQSHEGTHPSGGCISGFTIGGQRPPKPTEKPTPKLKPKTLWTATACPRCGRHYITGGYKDRKECAHCGKVYT